MKYMTMLILILVVLGGVSACGLPAPTAAPVVPSATAARATNTAVPTQVAAAASPTAAAAATATVAATQAPPTATLPPPTATLTPTTAATATLQPTATLSATIPPTPLPISTSVPTSQAAGQPPERYALTDVTITLERTPCFGACPDYTVVLRGDGTVQYTGRRFVKVEGEQKSTITRDAFVELLSEFYRIDFFALKDDYFDSRTISVSADGQVEEQQTTVTDLPTTFVTLEIGGYRKRIRAYWGTPEELVQLANQIDTAAGTVAWVKP